MTLRSYIFGRTKRFRVTGPVVVALRASNVEAYVYHGGLLPADTLQHQIESLLQAGLIEEVEVSA